MFQALYDYDSLSSPEKVTYRPRAYGEVDADGRWTGWLVFFPLSNHRRVIATARETTQPSFQALLDWATTLTPVYLAGALLRALDLQRSLPEQPAAIDRPSPDEAAESEQLEATPTANKVRPTVKSRSPRNRKGR